MVGCRMRSQRRLADDRGIALAVVLLILVVVLLMGTTLVGISVTENRAGSVGGDMRKAFSAAETGIQEAIYRMRLDPNTFSYEGPSPGIPCAATADPLVVGLVQGTPPNAAPISASPDPTNPNFWKYNPPACSWAYAGSSASGYGNYLGGTAANLDSAGRTFTSLGSSHATGGPLVNANLANGASYTVTMAPVVGFVGGCWQYVDQFGAPLGSCASVPTNPLFKVTSTGTLRGARKTLSTMIQRYSFKPKLEAALTANSDVEVHSHSAVIDGHNYDCNGNNPSDQDSTKAVTVPSDDKIKIKKDQNLQCTAGTGANCVGTSPPFPDSLGALLLGPSAKTKEVEALNAYLESIKVDPKDAPDKKDPPYHGILYVAGKYKQPPDGSSGVLIVHNKKDKAKLGHLKGGTFKGLIIADKIDKVHGGAQIIGGIIALDDHGKVHADDDEGTPSIKYSQCAIAEAYRYFSLRTVSGTWHEQQPPSSQAPSN